LILSLYECKQKEERKNQKTDVIN